jgi:hypothetical protein
VVEQAVRAEPAVVAALPEAAAVAAEQALALVEEVVRVRLQELVQERADEVQAVVLVPAWLPHFQVHLLQQRRARLLQVDAADRPVAVDAVVDRAVVEPAAVLEADLPLRAIARVPQFRAWKSSTPCSQRAPIRMWH